MKKSLGRPATLFPIRTFLSISIASSMRSELDRMRGKKNRSLFVRTLLTEAIEARKARKAPAGSEGSSRVAPRGKTSQGKAQARGAMV